MVDKERYLADFGRRVRAARERLGLSQDELSVRCGYEGGRGTISKIELGQSDVPISMVAVIADRLDTTVTYLLSIDKEDISRERAHEIGRLEGKIEAMEKQNAKYEDILRDAIRPHPPAPADGDIPYHSGDLKVGINMDVLRAEMSKMGLPQK